MNAQELKYRGDNLLAIGVTALVGFALIPEIFMESGGARVDDILLLLLGLGGLLWYFTSEHRYQKSIVPFVFVGLSFIVKLFSTFMESGSVLSMNDDVFALILFVLGTIVAIWLYSTSSDVDQKAGSMRA